VAVFKLRNCNKCSIEFMPDCSARVYCPPCAASNRDWYVWSLDYGRRLARLCSMAKNRARTAKVPFNIDREHLVELWDQNSGKCVLTGRTFSLEAWGDKGQVNPDAPSIDRINPKLGYVKGNVRLVTYHMNISLSDFGTELFKVLAESYLMQDVINGDR